MARSRLSHVAVAELEKAGLPQFASWITRTFRRDIAETHTYKRLVNLQLAAGASATYSTTISGVRPGDVVMLTAPGKPVDLEFRGAWVTNKDVLVHTWANIGAASQTYSGTWLLATIRA